MLCYLVNVNITGKNLLYRRYENCSKLNVRMLSRSRLTYDASSNLTDNDVVFSDVITS